MEGGRLGKKGPRLVAAQVSRHGRSEKSERQDASQMCKCFFYCSCSEGFPLQPFGSASIPPPARVTFLSCDSCRESRTWKTGKRRGDRGGEILNAASSNSRTDFLVHLRDSNHVSLIAGRASCFSYYQHVTLLAMPVCAHHPPRPPRVASICPNC